MFKRFMVAVALAVALGAGATAVQASENAGSEAMVSAICICWPTMDEGGWDWECWCP